MSAGRIYEQGAYVGLWRRIFILVFDLLTLLAAWIVLGTSTLLFSDNLQPSEELLKVAFVVWCVFSYFYLTVLKASRVRSVGLRLCRAKIVDHRGQAPSLLMMTFRVLLLITSPFTFLLDLMWLCSDKHRQTIRDKFTGTYIVNSRAQPVQTGHLQTRYYTILTALVPFKELVPDPIAGDDLTVTS